MSGAGGSRLVSIVMPAFRCEQYIDQAIASIADQSHRNLELIVVDDGSPDNTLVRAQAWERRDPRIAVIHQANCGKPGRVRNVGLARVRGDYVGFLDADDFVATDRIERCLDVFARAPELDALFHDMRYVDVGGNAIAGSYLSDAAFKERAAAHLEDMGEGVFLCRETYLEYMCVVAAGLHTNTVMMTRRAVDGFRLRFPEDVSIGEDTELWFALGGQCRLAYVDAVMSAYRQHGSSITRNQERMNVDLITVHSRNFVASGAKLSAAGRIAYRNRICDQYLAHGYFLSKMGRDSEARRAYLQSLKWRLRSGALIGIAKSCVPQKIRARRRERISDGS